MTSTLEQSTMKMDLNGIKLANGKEEKIEIPGSIREFKSDLKLGQLTIRKDLERNSKILGEIKECSHRLAFRIKADGAELMQMKKKKPLLIKRIQARIEECKTELKKITNQLDDCRKVLHKQDSVVGEQDSPLPQNSNQKDILHNKAQIEKECKSIEAQGQELLQKLNGVISVFAEIQKGENADDLPDLEVDLELNQQDRIESNYSSLVDAVLTSFDIQQMSLSWEDATIDSEFYNFQKSKPYPRMKSSMEDLFETYQKCQSLHAQEKKQLSELILIPETLRNIQNQAALCQQNALPHYMKDLEAGRELNQKFVNITKENQRRTQFQTKLVEMLEEENQKRESFAQTIKKEPETIQGKMMDCLHKGKYYPNEIKPEEEEEHNNAKIYNSFISESNLLQVSATEQVDNILTNPDRIDFERKITEAKNQINRLQKENSSLREESASHTKTYGIFQRHLKQLTQARQNTQDELKVKQIENQKLYTECQQLKQAIQPMMEENQRFKENERSMALQNKMMMEEYQRFLREHELIKKENIRLSEKLIKIQDAVKRKTGM